MNSQGNFVPKGHHDILVEAIGRPKHCGRVRATGKGVGIKLYFGVAPRQLSFTPKRPKKK